MPSVPMVVVGATAAVFLLGLLLPPSGADAIFFALGWYVEAIRSLPRRIASRLWLWATYVECWAFSWWGKIGLAWSRRMWRRITGLQRELGG